jgi:hypothetical protein
MLERTSAITIVIILIVAMLILYWLLPSKYKLFGGGIPPHDSKYIGINPTFIPDRFIDFFTKISEKNINDQQVKLIIQKDILHNKTDSLGSFKFFIKCYL